MRGPSSALVKSDRLSSFVLADVKVTWRRQPRKRRYSDLWGVLIWWAGRLGLGWSSERLDAQGTAHGPARYPSSENQKGPALSHRPGIHQGFFRGLTAWHVVRLYCTACTAGEPQNKGTVLNVLLREVSSSHLFW